MSLASSLASFISSSNLKVDSYGIFRQSNTLPANNDNYFLPNFYNYFKIFVRVIALARRIMVMVRIPSCFYFKGNTSNTSTLSIMSV